MNTIDITGNPTFVPFVTNGILDNTLLVSGNDIGLGGNPGQTTREAGIFAHQQVKFHGNPTVYGFVVAEGGRQPFPLDPAPNPYSGQNRTDENTVSGNVTIHYDGAEGSPLMQGPETLTLLSWTEVRSD